MTCGLLNGIRLAQRLCIPIYPYWRTQAENICFIFVTHYLVYYYPFHCSALQLKEFNNHPLSQNTVSLSYWESGKERFSCLEVLRNNKLVAQIGLFPDCLALPSGNYGLSNASLWWCVVTKGDRTLHSWRCLLVTFLSEASVNHLSQRVMFNDTGV